MVLYVDSRGQGESELYTLLKERHLAVEQKYLESGDIVFGTIGIERKTISDLISSVIGGNRHLWTQLKILRDTYEHPMVLIEGTINYKDKLLSGIIFAILKSWKIPIIPTYNIYDSAEAIYRLFTKCGNNQTKSYPPVAVKKASTVKEIQWCMLQSIRGIGPTVSKEILKRAEFINIGNQNPKKLSKSIRGLGLKTATKLVKVFK